MPPRLLRAGRPTPDAPRSFLTTADAPRAPRDRRRYRAAARVNQYQWTFLDNLRRRHTLGIAHSATSGHLVVHCDHRVVLIDFEVLREHTYTFFVED